MEFAINNGFAELSMDDMREIDGGGVWEATKAFAGCVLVGFSPAVGVGVGIVAGPIAGISAGANVFAAIEEAKKDFKKNIVVIIPDTGERYLSSGVFN